MRTSNWVLEPNKYLNKLEAMRLLSTARLQAEDAISKNKKIAVRDYFVIHLALMTGLRVMEIAALKISDIFLDEEVCSILVRKGKGGKKRIVRFTRSLKDHCKNYLSWKQKHNESTKPQAPLLRSSNTGDHMTTRAIQKIFKRCAKRAHLEPDTGSRIKNLQSILCSCIPDIRQGFGQHFDQFVFSGKSTGDVLISILGTSKMSPNIGIAYNTFIFNVMLFSPEIKLNRRINITFIGNFIERFIQVGFQAVTNR